MEQPIAISESKIQLLMLTCASTAIINIQIPLTTSSYRSLNIVTPSTPTNGINVV